MPSATEVWAGIGLSVGFLALIAIAQAWRRFRHVPAELTRKLVHTGGGLGCLAIPVLIESHWVVLAMSIALAAVFMVSRYTGHLRSIHAVSRSSLGTEYYPLVIYALFILAYDRPWLYVISVLVLAVSDAAAALIGSRYGRIRYQIDQDHKSLEGSLVFALITYVVIVVPLVAWGDPSIPPTAECMLVALLTACLVTCFEAISTGGRDNLIVPLGTYLVLTKMLRQPLNEIVLQNLSFVAIATAIGIAAWRTHMFNAGGSLVVLLWVYGCWSLGSLHWAIPVGLGLALYVAVRLATRDLLLIRMRLAMRAVGPLFAVLAAANFAFVIDRVAVYQFLYGPFVAGCTIVATMICWNRILARYPRKKHPVVAVLAGGIAALVIGLPIQALQIEVPLSALAWIVAVTMGAGAYYNWTIRQESPSPVGTRNRLTLASITIIAALQWLELSPLWTPQ